MENQDKIYKQFKNAADKATLPDFAGMEKVWSRVDAKLDTVVYKKQTNSWKTLTVAASVIIIGIIAFQFLKPETKIKIPVNQVVIKEPIKEFLPENTTEENETENPILKTETQEILQKQIEIEPKVADVTLSKDVPEPVVETKSDSDVKPKTNYMLRGLVFEAIGVQSSNQEVVEKTENQVAKNEALVVVDGKAIINGKKSGEKVLSELDKDKFETIYLAEPLYIINGYYYSEEDLFGKNPTSPYAPLDKQEIKTIKILQTEAETAPYGQKGKKGVVVITTKTGKPVVPK
jgi:hypothetical protein